MRNATPTRTGLPVNMLPTPIVSIAAPITPLEKNVMNAVRRMVTAPEMTAPANIPPAQHAVNTPKAVGPKRSDTVIRNTKAMSEIAPA